MDLDRLNTGEKIAGVSAVLLLHLHVLRLVRGRDLRRRRLCRLRIAAPAGNAWDAFGFIHFVLVVAIAAALINVFLRLSDSDYEPPVSMNVAVAVLGGLVDAAGPLSGHQPAGLRQLRRRHRRGDPRIRTLPRPARGDRHRLRRLQGMQEEGVDLQRRPPTGSPAATGPAAAPAVAAPPPPPPPPPPGSHVLDWRQSRAVAASAAGGEPSLVAVGDAARDPLGEGDDRHHRVDARRGGKERGVGDVESASAVDRRRRGDRRPGAGRRAIRAVPIGWNASRRSSRGPEAGRLELAPRRRA